MRVLQLVGYGEVDQLRVAEVRTPIPEHGKVLVRILSASLNYADIVRRRGDPYPLPTPLPAVLGSEAAGVIEALGPGVEDLYVGQPVFVLFGGTGLGGFAEFAAVSRDEVFPLPKNSDLDVACTIVVAGVTAHNLIHEVGRLSPGESVFIPGTVGGVGSYAIQLARSVGGVTILGGASTDERRALALSRGADVAIDYTLPNWSREVLEVTNGRGVDLLLDMNGGTFFEECLKALAPFGRLISYGSASRQRSQLVPQALMPRNQSVIGYYVSHWFTQRPQRSREIYDDLLKQTSSGNIKVAIAGRVPLDGVADAQMAMQERRSTGKFVVKPWM